MRISVFGLGKLGAPMAAVFAARGHTVIGVDTCAGTVDCINAGRAPVYEPGLAELLRTSRRRLSATSDGPWAVVRSDVTFIIVPTPSEADGGFSLRNVLAAADAIGRGLREKKRAHLVVLSSTVMPGSTGDVLRPELERISRRRCGPDFGLCYSPEFIALGSVIRDMLHPDMILIGESDRRAGTRLERLLLGICRNRPRVARMNFVNAELAKLSVNTFITAKITYANMLSRICERLPGGDVDVVTAALGLDTRIGARYLKGALGYGGPCFPRDNLALACLADRLGACADLAVTTDRMNRGQIPQLAEAILAGLPPGGVVGILGLAYKAGTDVVEESQGVALAEDLLSQGVPVVVHDPAALEPARQRLCGRVSFAPTVRECVRQAHVVVITTPWPQFQKLSPKDLNCSLGRPVVVDCWRMLNPRRFQAAAQYVTLGSAAWTFRRDESHSAAARQQKELECQPARGSS
jgi:UDPglucose 6-dehydrogenase